MNPTNFSLIGHRGNGMNSKTSENPVKENSILSFNTASLSGIQFVEFDVQVTKDNHPVIFHDNFILSREDDGTVSEKLVVDLSLEVFLSYNSKQLVRKAHDGEVYDWAVETDCPLCTLEEAFVKVEDTQLGFNIELKFDDDIAYQDEELINTLEIILHCVSENAGNRRVIFSTFQPDAARLVRGLQGDYPVFFLTDGGVEIYGDLRRNSLEEAVRLCLENGLQGIVSEVRAVLGNPNVVREVTELGLGLMTYGEMNNVGEVVCLQRMMGIDGVIVDKVREIAEVVSGFGRQDEDEDEDEGGSLGRVIGDEINAVLLKLVPNLVLNWGELGMNKGPIVVS